MSTGHDVESSSFRHNLDTRVSHFALALAIIVQLCTAMPGLR